ncbi:HNH endonuclease [Peptococcaceae bacterium CEB3]|nr:HNH endonuclease [Peptococcaceae bacterium CEB3]
MPGGCNKHNEGRKALFSCGSRDKMLSLQIEKRIEDSSAIEAVRTKYCKYVDPATGVRCNQPVFGQPHHIKSRGAGGDDIKENLISLCGECHRKAHDGNIARQTLVQIVADREGIGYDEVCAKIRLYPSALEKPSKPTELPEGGALPRQEPSLEEMISAYVQIDEQEKNARWIKGQLLSAMLDSGVQQGWLASQVGSSTAQIRELVKVYRAFPQEGMRVPSLSWYHHRVAANSPDPAKYIQEAADQELSTRQMRKAILEDEGKQNIVQEEQSAEQKQAEKILKTVDAFLAKGGEAAEYLKAQLAVLIQCTQETQKEGDTLL